MDQQHYVGLDVSLDTTSICVVDQSGTIIWRGKCGTEPEAISQAVRKHAPAAVCVGLETGQMSNWLTLQLRKLGLPVVCLDARHAKGALSMQLNKTDANDAHGLAQVVRTGWFREVAIKSMDAQALRMLLMARAQLVSQRQAVANNIRGLLKTFGFVIARGSKGQPSRQNRRCRAPPDDGARRGCDRCTGVYRRDRQPRPLQTWHLGRRIPRFDAAKVSVRRGR